MTMASININGFIGYLKTSLYFTRLRRTVIMLKKVHTNSIFPHTYRLFAKNIICVGSEIGRLPPQFGDAAKIASMIMTCGFEFNVGKAYYNYFK